MGFIKAENILHDIPPDEIFDCCEVLHEYQEKLQRLKCGRQGHDPNILQADRDNIQQFMTVVKKFHVKCLESKYN